jgi:hypothetical protein
MILPSGRPRRQWQHVNKAHPCPICGKADWCSVSTDGQVAACRRVEAGAWRSKTDKAGAPIYLHRLDGSTRPEAPPRPPAGPAAGRADPETLHRVYDALLGALTLSERHRQDLRRRGLSDGEIDRRLYRSLPRDGRTRARLAGELRERWPADVLSVPGIIRRERDGRRFITLAGAPGLLVPCRDVAGRVLALKIRRDDPGDGPRYSYLSSAKYGGPGPGSPVHVPLGVTSPCQRLSLTEGELKADVATVLSELPTISVPGVANWKTCLPTLQQLQPQTVIVSFDADASDKPKVARALAECVGALEAAGYDVQVERWDPKYKGIDDALAAGVLPEKLAGDDARAFVAEALAAATAGEEPAPPDPLERLPDVLRDGGPAALFGDRELLQALARLAETDPAAWAERRARLRTAGVKLRDLDGALAPLRQALRAARPLPDAAGEYRISGGRIIHTRQTNSGPVEAPLCNFHAQIVEQVTFDDGAERSSRLCVEGALADGTPLPRVEVAADQFGWMQWIIPAWGTRAVVGAGRGTADHLRAALQLLSGDVPQRVVYGHLGWRQLPGRWLYLHAGGAIGPSGPAAGVEVAPPEALARFVLPPPPSGDDLRRAVLASIDLLTLGPRRVAYPLLAATYRAPLGPADYALHLCGPTGAGKSELAALMVQHYGAAMDRLGLPASWASTGNSLETLAFAAADALLVVDDFAPAGGAADVGRLHAQAERLLRAQGNAAGRARCRIDGTVRPARPPRGTILSTGEDVPRGQSLRARLLVLELAPGDVPLAGLTPHQQAAAAGLYAQALAGFVRWLAPQYGDVRGRLAGERAELRDLAAGAGGHARTPGIVADLAIGLRYLLAYAVEAGAIDAARQRELWERGWAALLAAGAAQAQHVEAAEPAGHFVRLLAAALASGRAHLAAPDGGYPEAPAAWGWRHEDAHGGPIWRPQGRRVGWLDAGDVLLEPDASYAEAQELARLQGDSLTAQPRTLWRRLRERGLLASWDAARETLTVRRTLGGQRRDVLHLRTSCLSADDPTSDGPDPTNPTNPTSDPTTPSPRAATAYGEMVGLVGFLEG